MKIRIATEGLYPDGMASTYRIHCYALALNLAKFKVEVVAAGSQSKVTGKSFFQRGTRAGINYIVLQNLGTAKNKIINHIWQEAKPWCVVLYNSLTFYKYDVLFLYQGAALPRLFLILLLKILGKKVILELNEYPYKTGGSRISRIVFINKLLTWITFNLIFPLSSGIVCISDSLQNEIAERYPNIRTIKIPILIANRYNEHDVVKSIQELVLKKEKYLFHAGSLSESKDGIIAFVKAYAKAASEMKKNNETLNLVLTNNKTQSHIWRHILEILQKNDLRNNLVITGFLNDQQLNYGLANSSVLIINKPESVQNKYNFPTKLGDYLLSGRPVIAASQGLEMNNYLINGKNCLLAKPNCIRAISDAILRLMQNPDLSKEIGSNGAGTALEKFHYRQHSNDLKEFIESI